MEWKPACCTNVDIHDIHYYGILGKLWLMVYHIVIQKDFDIQHMWYSLLWHIREIMVNVYHRLFISFALIQLFEVLVPTEEA
jgi:hypothetical protein